MEGWKVVQRSRTKRYVQHGRCGVPWSILSMSYYVPDNRVFTGIYSQRAEQGVTLIAGGLFLVGEHED